MKVLSPRIQTVRWTIALVTFFVAIIALLYGPSRLEYPTPFYINHLAVVIDTFILAATFYAAIGLIVGKKVAWRVAVIVLVIAAVWDTIESNEYISIFSIFPVVGLFLLGLTRKYYQVANGQILTRHVLRRVLIFTIISTIIGCLAFYILAYVEHRPFGLIDGMIESLSRMYQPQDIFETVRQLSIGHVIGRTLLPVLGIINYILIALALLQPVADRFRQTSASQRNVIDLLDRYATSSEDSFKYFPKDKSYFFGKKTQGFIAYGVYQGVCIALADPIAENEVQKRKLIVEFTHFCSTNGWQFAFLAVSEESQCLYEYLKMIKIGENAQIHIAQYISNLSEKNVRNVHNRFSKAGYTASFEDSTDENIIDELRVVSNSWLSGSGRMERQFAVGYFDKVYLGQSRVFVVRDSSHHIMAFINLQPNYSNTKQASIDLMRFGRNVQTNTMDFLLISLIRQLYTEGWESLDLGLAPLAGLEGSQNINERGLHVLYRYANRWFSFRGLRRFKNKFHPIWEPRYLAYSGSGAKFVIIARAINELMKYKL